MIFKVAGQRDFVLVIPFQFCNSGRSVMLTLFGRSGILVTTLATFMFAGCSNEPRLYPVSGSVSLDGQPVADGDIMFVSTDGVRGPDPGKIKDGNYALKTTEGKKRVEISASKIRPGGARGGGGEPVPEEYIPTRYNMESKLNADVQPNNKNRFDFTLEGK